MFGYGRGFGRGRGRGDVGGGFRNYGNTRGQRGGQEANIFMMANLVRTVMNLERKPPVTLAFMALMGAVHYQPDLIAEYLGIGSYGGLSQVHNICLNPRAIVEQFSEGHIDVIRLLGSAFIHGDSTHLYYNMVSFLWKGVALETGMMGSAHFLQALVILLILSQSLIVVLSWAMAEFARMGESYHMCAVGFSGVIFALKYILNHRSQGPTNVMGFKVNIRYAAWLELVAIQLVVPNASFLGHLCGILAGMCYEHGGYFLQLPMGGGGTIGGMGRARPSYTYAAGTSGGGHPPPPSAPQHGSQEQTEEEWQLQEALRRSMQDRAR